MTKTISTYIITINSLFFQSTLEQTIRQSALFSDEIIVSVSEHTSDGTFILLDTLCSEYPNIIKIFTYKDEHEKLQEDLANRKTFALRKCTKDFCVLQDDDECIHEKYVDNIKMLPDLCPDTIAFRFNTIHFYRSFNKYQNSPNWYPKKIYMIKNMDSIKHGMVGTDPDNHVIFNSKINRYMPLDDLPSPKILDTQITSYHYGWCRNDAILLLKKYFQEVQWWGTEYWKSHEFPFKFDDPNTLKEFKDTHPKYMIPLIEYEKRFNTRHIKDFNK